jgi:integrase
MSTRKSERKSLTDANVADLEAREKKYEVWDDGSRSVRGFCVRVEVSGLKTFYFRYSLRGLFWYRIGPADMGADVARKEAKKLTGLVANDINPHRERKAKRGGLTFEQLQKRYVEEKAKKHNKSWEQADKLIRARVLPKWGKLPAASITRAEVRQLFASISAPRTANLVKAAISAVFKFGIEQEVIANNPCRDIEDNPTEDRERILFESEVPLFWAACDKVHPVKALALKVVLLTGQRPGEVSHMRREHIRGDGFWTLPGEPVPELGWPGTKNKRTHRVWLTQPVLELIGEGTDGFVFASERGNAFGGLHDVMREVTKLCSFDPEVTPHDLRRTFASTVTERGHGGEAMDRLLNHHKKGVRATYDRAQKDKLNRPIWEDVAPAITQMVEGRSEDNVTAFRPIAK